MGKTISRPINTDAIETARQEMARAMRYAAIEAHRAVRQQEREAGIFDYSAVSWETTNIQPGSFT
jgi:hypothetical protein